MTLYPLVRQIEASVQLSGIFTSWDKALKAISKLTEGIPPHELIAKKQPVGEGSVWKVEISQRESFQVVSLEGRYPVADRVVLIAGLGPTGILKFENQVFDNFEEAIRSLNRTEELQIPFPDPEEQQIMCQRCGGLAITVSFPPFGKKLYYLQVMEPDCIRN